MRNRWFFLVVAMAVVFGAKGQVKLSPDTLECHVINFNLGAMMPGMGRASTGVEGGNTKDLYSGPYLDFAIGCDYKYKSNWLVTLDGDIWFSAADENLIHKFDRMSDIYTPEGYILDWGGMDGALRCYNRSLSLRVGAGKILPVIKGNPNSGVLLKLSTGWAMQKTVFSQDEHSSPVRQLSGEYAKLYDHLRNGVVLTEGIGFYYMNNYATYINFKITFEVTQMWSWSSRPYVLDNYMGLHGKDNNRYFDLLYGLKLTWMFPLMGKTTYDYYYY